MPYIEMLSNTKFDAETTDKLNQTFGELITIIPGKTERWLMVHIEDGAKLCFAGDSESSAAIITLQAFGRELSTECYDTLTREICESCSKISGIPQDRIYVKYDSITHWGWNGRNF